MNRLLCFYGDDFTGGSAAMEVLAFAGVPTVLFLDPPSREQLDRFPDLRAMGIAGVARSRDPEWMDENLPTVFEAMAGFGAPVSHYKCCSTFDSSPTRGSIGKAIEVGAPLVGGAWHPLVVAAPELGRYQSFGNLFAQVDGIVHRLDRHPVMGHHPSTPMDEADLGLHLGRQTTLPIALLDFATIKAGRADVTVAALKAEGAEVISIDVIDDETLAEAGRLIWNRGTGPTFAVGSQGVEYALVAHWRAIGLLPDRVDPPRPEPVDHLLVVSGSCSPVNAAQIDDAEDQGFVVIELDATQAVEPGRWASEVGRVTQLVAAALEAGRDTILTTARGVESIETGHVAAAIRASGARSVEVHDRIGSGLGAVVATMRRARRIPRVVIAGGDTSSHAMNSLDAFALGVKATVAPGAPLCEVYSTDPEIDGLELALKGGQMGAPDYFTQAKGNRLFHSQPGKTLL